jgi:flagellar biosynthetic protein FliR
MIQSDQIILLTGKFLVGTLILIRIGGFMLFGPLFKTEGIPTQLKIMFSVILATSITSAFWYDQPKLDFHLWFMVLLVLKEFTMGAIMGFSANTVFFAARFAGGMIDYTMGFQSSAVFANQDTPTLVGELKDMMTLMIFLAINGHHQLIEGVFLSVRAVPIGTFEITQSTYRMLIDLMTNVTIIAFKMSAPMLIAQFLVNLALSLLARVAPQTNIFSLSYQVKIGVGLLVLFATLSLFGVLAKNSVANTQNDFIKFIMTLNPIRV